VQRAGRVGHVVLVAQRPHLDRDLGVPVARQVGEEVVLDLEAEVADRMCSSGRPRSWPSRASGAGTTPRGSRPRAPPR
jgi:hypothetical protein